MPPPAEDLSRRLAKLNLNSNSTNNFNVPPSSLSSNPQLQYPSNTHFGYGFGNNVMTGNNFAGGFVNVVSHVLNPGIVLDLNYLKTVPVNSLIKFAETEQGSRALQEILKMRKPEITEKIFEQVTTTSEVGIPNIFHLMISQHGWFVFSKLIDACNERQLDAIVYQITWSSLFIQISLTKFGSLSVIKLIKFLKKSPLVDFVVFKLAIDFYRLMTERHGLYILSECLDHLDEKKNEVLYLSAIKHCRTLALHKEGCISLNTVIDKIRGTYRLPLINFICDQAVPFALDPSGNFVVQKVLALENPIYTDKITEKLKGRYASLSKQKEGSHLVEKCLRSTRMLTVVQDLIDSNQVMSIAEDRYGNYVIQTALRVTKGIASTVHSRLLGCMYPQYHEKLQHGFARKVYNMMVDEILEPHQTIFA